MCLLEYKYDPAVQFHLITLGVSAHVPYRVNVHILYIKSRKYIEFKLCIGLSSIRAHIPIQVIT